MNTAMPHRVSIEWRPFVVFLILTLALDTSGAESNLQRTFSVEAGGTLEVDADRGSIQVTTADQAQVKIEVTRKLNRVKPAKSEEIFAAHEVTFEQEGERVVVRAQVKKALRHLFGRGDSDLQVAYKIAIPQTFNLELKTAAGSISGGDIEGTVQARTSGGSLKFGKVKGTFEGHTAAGSIEVSSATGPVTAHTSGGSIHFGETGSEADLATSAGSITIGAARSKLEAGTSGGSIEAGELHGPARLQTAAGSIRVRSASGALNAKTSGGNIAVDEAADSVVAQTAAGSVSVSFCAQPKDECRLATSGGNVQVSLVPGLKFDVDARANGGRVVTEVPVEATIRGEQKPATLAGKINGGGPGLVLKTSAGSIKILQRAE